MSARIRIFETVLVALLAFILEGCAGGYSGGNGRRSMNADVLLLSFGTVQGELAPCG